MCCCYPVVLLDIRITPKSTKTVVYWLGICLYGASLYHRYYDRPVTCLRAYKTILGTLFMKSALISHSDTYSTLTEKIACEIGVTLELSTVF